MRMDSQRVHGLASRVLLPCLDADDRRRLHEGPRPRGYPTTRVSGRRYGMGRVPSGAIVRKMWRAGPCDTICARFQQGSHECHRGRETFVLECSWCMYAEAAEVALR